MIDALAPEVGALAGAAVALTGHAYAIGLAVYAGIFLMIGTASCCRRPTASGPW